MQKILVRFYFKVFFLNSRKKRAPSVHLFLGGANEIVLGWVLRKLCNRSMWYYLPNCYQNIITTCYLSIKLRAEMLFG